MLDDSSRSFLNKNQSLTSLPIPIMVDDPCLTDRSIAYSYRVADQDICSNVQLTLVEEVATTQDCCISTHQDLPFEYDGDRSPSPEGVVFDGPALLGNAMRQTNVRMAHKGASVSIEGIGRFTVSCDGTHIDILERHPDISDDLLAEGVLGIPFAFSLAARNIWLLHGSAAEFQGRHAIFFGESGYGKSTLARFLHGQPGWRRIADDVLPATVNCDGFQALPHFPQLKLSSEEQPAVYMPQHLRIDAIYAISSPAEATNSVEIANLPSMQAVTTIVSQGVSTRAFDSRILAKHFHFCHGLASMVPVKQLNYPREWDSLPEIQRLLEQDIVSCS